MATLWMDEQIKNAQTIISVGRARGASDRDIVVALMTAMQESSLKNLDDGHLDSAGLFQQRPSMGWGTHAQVTDPEYAANTFFDRLEKVEGRETMPLTKAAQTVQKSAYPNAYAKWEDDARDILKRDTYDSKKGSPLDIVPESVTTGLDNVNNAFSAITNPDMWKRIGVGALGVALVIIGIIIMLSGTDAARKGLSAAAGIATKGVIK